MDIVSLSIDPQAAIALGLMVVAVIKLIDQIYDRDWKGTSKIIGAGVVGALVAVGVDGLTVLSGIVIALSGSGLLTTVGFAKKSPLQRG